MDNQKVVVVLLLITIILAIVSVVITFSADAGSSKDVEIRNIEEDDSVGTIGFEIEDTSSSGGAG